jgi:translation initiation factor 1
VCLQNLPLASPVASATFLTRPFPCHGENQKADRNKRHTRAVNSFGGDANKPDEAPDWARRIAKRLSSLWKPGRVVLRRERARRSGKTVIVIDDFATHLPISVIEKTAKKIRIACGCGGTVRDRAIEIQGDQPGKIRAVLEAEGYQVAGIK